MSDDKFTTIAALAVQDYDGSEDMDAGAAERILRDWSRNNVSARRMIESRGMPRAVAEYLAGWNEAHRDEYQLDE